MARILLNHRASRITIVDKILLLPAEVRTDDQHGKVVTPSRTLISEKGSPSPFERVVQDRGTQRLFTAGILAWSNDVVDEPDAEPAATESASSPKAAPAPGPRKTAASGAAARAG